MLSDKAAALLRELQGVSWLPTYNVCGCAARPHARGRVALRPSLGAPPAAAPPGLAAGCCGCGTNCAPACALRFHARRPAPPGPARPGPAPCTPAGLPRFCAQCSAGRLTLLAGACVLGRRRSCGTSRRKSLSSTSGWKRRLRRWGKRPDARAVVCLRCGVPVRTLRHSGRGAEARVTCERLPCAGTTMKAKRAEQIPPTCRS